MTSTSTSSPALPQDDIEMADAAVATAPPHGSSGPAARSAAAGSEVPVAQALAEWAVAMSSTEENLALARRSLLDTAAVGIAAREHHILEVGAVLGEAGRWAAPCHVIDFDDLQMPSTTHISTVCVPVTLSTTAGGDVPGNLPPTPAHPTPAVPPLARTWPVPG